MKKNLRYFTYKELPESVRNVYQRGGQFQKAADCVHTILGRIQSEEDDPKYFLGVLNSRLLWYFMRVTGTVLRGGYLRFKTEYLRPFPIPCSVSRNPPPESQQKEVTKLVDRILTAKQRDASADTSALEREIDQLVYKLGVYPADLSALCLAEGGRLTEKEIGIVEGTK